MQQEWKALNLDERDAVHDLLDHAGWRPLLKLVEGFVREQEAKLLSLNVADGENKIVHQKLRAEGAKQVSKDLATLPQYIKKLSKG